jgi:VWFA-related protein
MALRRILLIGFVGVLEAMGFQTPDQQTATFQAGTRLVEVEVVVRGKQGPVVGLKKEDFTVLDQGKPQRIDVFHSGPVSSGNPAIPLPPGAVSNRVDNLGKALPSGTVLLFDRLNTRLDFKAYEGEGMLKFIRGLGRGDRVAIYALGKSLHVVQDFTDDPARLLAALASLDSGRDMMPANLNDVLVDYPPPAKIGIWTVNVTGTSVYKNAIMDTAETNVQVNVANNDQTTTEALMRIVNHLSRVPGRRNLVWIKEEPVVPPPVMGMLLQANVALYPVLVRTVGMHPSDGDSIGTANLKRFLPEAPDFMATQHAGQALAEATGGTSFNDASDLETAVKTAEEDSRSAYTLGYYPSEEALDGKYHRLSVRVAGEKGATLEMHYRPGYVATKKAVAMPVPPQEAAFGELFADPLDATGLGLTARTSLDSSKPGTYQVMLRVDLHDVHLAREGNRSTGKLEIALPHGNEIHITAINIDLSDVQLAESLATGLGLVISGVEIPGDSIRLAARDPSTGIAGSVRTPVRAKSLTE